jgi:hypothetical protein
MKPTIGRIVHFHPELAYEVSGNPTPEEIAVTSKPLPLITHAAIITNVHEVDGVAWPVLRILGDYPGEDFPIDCRPGRYAHDGVREAEVPTMGCWNWPPRV